MKATRILIWSVVLMLTLSFVSQAQESEPVREITSQRTGLDLIFAIDCSGSLKSNDPDRTGLGMVKTFIDTIHAEDIRIGYVAYNGFHRLFTGYGYGVRAFIRISSDAG